MFLIIPIFAYALWFFLFKDLYLSRREACLAAAAWWTLELVGITEFLSLFHALTPFWLAMAWLCATATLTAFWVVKKRRLLARPVPAPLRESVVNVSTNERFMLLGALLICGLVGLTAAFSPPNGSDQLQYHLPRVAEWASRRSIAFFPTHYYVQLFAPPLAEWMMLHSYILTGGDRFVSLVQWLTFVGSALGVSLIAKELAANVQGQILAGFLCVTLPQGILAASGAKNDWVLSFWLVAVVFFLFRWCREPGWLTSCNLGIAVGAALLSKGSVYTFLPPIALTIVVWRLRQHWRTALRFAPIAIALTLLMNTPQWARNRSLGGSIFGLSAPDVAGKEKYTVDRLTVPGIASNLLRESAMHLSTPLASVNRRETNMVRSLISAMGVDPDDKALTNYSRFELPEPYFNRDEYYAGNPLHLLLIVAAFGLMLAAPRKTSPAGLALALGLIGGFVIYCSLFKWEMWCARLHLPLFVIACAFVAVVICQRFPKIVFPLALIAFLAALPPTFCNETRPLLFSGGLHNLTGRTSVLLRSRPELYFTQQSQLKDTYTKAAEAIRSGNCDDIGVDTLLRPYSHEYPLIELGKRPGRTAEFRYVDVHNLSSQYADRSDLLPPCLIICPNCRDHKEMWDKYLPVLPVARGFGDLIIFSRAAPHTSDNKLSDNKLSANKLTATRLPF